MLAATPRRIEVDNARRIEPAPGSVVASQLSCKRRIGNGRHSTSCPCCAKRRNPNLVRSDVIALRNRNNTRAGLQRPGDKLPLWLIELLDCGPATSEFTSTLRRNSAEYSMEIRSCRARGSDEPQINCSPKRSWVSASILTREGRRSAQPSDRLAAPSLYTSPPSPFPR